jgi:hypothetical protein
MASVSISFDLPKATVDEVNGEMAMTFSGGAEVYTMTVLPPKTSGLVLAEKKGILKNIDLKKLIDNLKRASDLLYLAYMCTYGVGDLPARIATRQSELLKLCGECVFVINDLKSSSEKVLQQLLNAYSYLLEADETEAIYILSECATHAKTMAARCQKLKDGFGTLREKTVDDKGTAIREVSKQVAEIAKFDKERAEMQAAESKHLANVADMNRSMVKLEQDITKAEAREEKAADYELVMGIMGAFAGAAGAALGAVVKIKSFGFLGGSPSKSDGEKTDAAKMLELQKEISETAKKQFDVADEEEKNASKDKEVVSKDLLNAVAQTKTDQTRLDGASTQTRKEAEAALKSSEAKMKRLEEEVTKADERLKKAARKRQTLLEAYEGAGEALKNLQVSLKEMAQGQRDRVKEAASLHEQLVQRLNKMEDDRRESLVELATLATSLNSNVEVARVADETKKALDIAVKAIANVEATLHSATVFWTSMQTCCEELATPDSCKEIERLVEKKTPEYRVKFYKSKRFVPTAVRYICKWTALISVCDEYHTATRVVEESVEHHIRKSPNREEAKSLIKDLKKQLLEEFGSEISDIDTAKNSRIAGKDTITDGSTAHA